MPKMLASIINPKDLVNKEYVDKLMSGVFWAPAAVAADTNQALSGSGNFVVDGVTLTSGQRAVLVGQDDKKQNGIYTVTITGGNWSLARATDADETNEFHAGKTIYVLDGTTYGKSMFIQTSTVTTPGAEDIEFAVLSSSDEEVAASYVGTLVGDNTASVFTLTHGLGTKNVIVQTYKEEDGARLICDVVTPDENTVVITTASPIDTGKFIKAVVISADIKVAGKVTSNDVAYSGTTPALADDTMTAALDTTYTLAASKVALGDIPVASKTANGLMSKEDKEMLDAVPGATVVAINTAMNQKITYGTEDIVAGETPLPAGTLYMVYK